MSSRIFGSVDDGRANVRTWIRDSHQAVSLVINTGNDGPGEVLASPELGVRIRQIRDLVAGHPC